MSRSAYDPLVELIDHVRRLRVLVALDDTGSFSAAARRLGMTQSAASQHIGALERNLDLTLVDRQTRPVQLSEVGLRLAHHGRLLQRLLELAEQEVLELAGRRDLRLRLAAFPSALTTFVPAALKQFRRQRPDVVLSLVDGHMPELVGMLDAGEVDLAITYGRVDDPIRADHDVLRDDVYRVVLPRGHRLARRDAVRLRDLADDPWVGSRSEGGWFRIVSDACRAEGFTPKVALTTDDYLTVQAMVASTLGVAVIPGLAVRPSRQVAALPIAGRPVVRRMWVVRRPGLARAPATRELVSALAAAARAWT